MAVTAASRQQVYRRRSSSYQGPELLCSLSRDQGTETHIHTARHLPDTSKATWQLQHTSAPSITSVSGDLEHVQEQHEDLREWVSSSF